MPAAPAAAGLFVSVTTLENLEEHRTLNIEHRTALSFHAVVVIAITVAYVSNCSAANEKPVTRTAEIQSISIGIDGKFKVGYLTSCSVTIAHQGPAVELQLDLLVPDGDGVQTRVTQTRVTKSATVEASSNKREETTIELFTKIGRTTGSVEVVLRDKQKTLARKSYDLEALAPMLPSDQLIVTIGEMLATADALKSRSRTADRGTTVVQITDVEKLPTRWYGYEGVNLVMLSTTTKAVQQLVDHQDRLGALKNWVRSGGRLVISAGAEAEPLIAAGRPLADLVPGTFDRYTAIRQLNRLEVFANAREALRREDELGRPLDFQIARLADVRGQIVVYEGRQSEDLPVLVWSSLGFGSVVFLGLDLEQPAMVAWSGTRNLVASLVEASLAAAKSRQSDANTQPSYLEYNDLTGQLRGALEQFDAQGVRRVPFVGFLLLAVLYVALIGPVDYFFLKRCTRRMELTWITLSLVVLAACFGAYWLASASKGRAVALNQVDLVDVDLDTGRYRGTSWFTVFSPETELYDLGLHPQLQTSNTGATDDTLLLSWLGLPGRVLGGMQSTAPPPRFDFAYSYSPGLNAMSNVPIQVWSTKAFCGRSLGQTTSRVDADLEIRDSNSQRTLAGPITNRLDVALSDCVLFYEHWTYSLGALVPDKEVRIEDRATVRTVATQLTRVGDWTTETEQERSDLPRLLSRMMFYRASGGIGFTPLPNDYQDVIDASHLLETGKAVLVGHAENPAFVVTRDDQPLVPDNSRRQTIYRFVFSIDD